MSYCCGSLWYCTADGPVEVSADGEGLYHPPEGWDGRPPHLTEAEALVACPPPPIAVDCGEFEYTLPAALTFSHVNPTGCFQSGSAVADPTTAASGAGCFNEGSDCRQRYQTNPDLAFAGGVACFSALTPTIDYWVELGLNPLGTGATWCVRIAPGAISGSAGYSWNFVGAGGHESGWGSGNQFCDNGPAYSGLDQTVHLPMQIGTIQFLSPSATVIGSAEVWIS